MFKQTYQHRCYSDNCAYTINANNFSSTNLRSEFKCNAKGSTGHLTMTPTWYIRYWHQIAPYVSDTADFDLKKAIFLMLQQQEQAKHAICFFLSLSCSLFFTFTLFVYCKVWRGIPFGSVHSVSCYPLFYCVKLGYLRRHQSERFTLTNPSSMLAWVLANIMQNPCSAVPEDIGPRMKGLTDKRKYIFALSDEFVSRGSDGLGGCWHTYSI